MLNLKGSIEYSFEKGKLGFRINEYGNPKRCGRCTDYATHVVVTRSFGTEPVCLACADVLVKDKQIVKELPRFDGTATNA